MTRRLMGCAAVAGLLLVGCGTEQQSETETMPAAEAEALHPTVARAVAVARGIAANPGAVDSVLAAHGLTAVGLDSLMYTIAEDAALSKAYADAMR
jgi:hypothetical protein